MLSVIIPTYNPSEYIIRRTIDCLKKQDLNLEHWELIIIDNASTNGVIDSLDISWHPNAKIVTEVKQGLTFARLRGFNEATGNIIVLVDDDNLLKDNYLNKVVEFFSQYPGVGIIGGKAIPEFEVKPPEWFSEAGIKLGCRDLGENVLITDTRAILAKDNKITDYPKFSPIGTGMALRKEISYIYLNKYKARNITITDRSKGNLSSGGDNDIVLTALNSGWEVGYFPELYVTHIIPKLRVRKEYLARMNYSSSKSWVKVLDMHGIRPWPKIKPYTIFLRKIKLYFVLRAWQSPVAYIRWKGSCGIFEAQSELI